MMRGLRGESLSKCTCKLDKPHTLTAILSHISLRLRTIGDFIYRKLMKYKPQYETLLLTVIDVSLEVQHIVRGEKVSAICALDYAVWWRRRPSKRVLSIEDKGRGRRRRDSLLRFQIYVTA